MRMFLTTYRTLIMINVMKKKVKTFFFTICQSLLPQHQFYKHILRTKFIFSLKYFFVLIFLLNFCLWTFLAIKYQPLRIFKLKEDLLISLNKFPKDLKINIEKGILTTNYDHPYFLWLDYQNSKILLLVVDESVSPEKINKYNAYFLLTRQDLVSKISTTKIIPWQNINVNLRIDWNFVQYLMTEIYNSMLLQLVILIGLFLFFVLPFFIFIFEFMYILIISWVIFSICYLFIKRLRRINFIKIIQLSLHSSTVPLIISFIFFAIFPKLNLNLWFPLLVLIFLSSAVYEVYILDEEHKHHS